MNDTPPPPYGAKGKAMSIILSMFASPIELAKIEKLKAKQELALEMYEQAKNEVELATAAAEKEAMEVVMANIKILSNDDALFKSELRTNGKIFGVFAQVIADWVNANCRHLSMFDQCIAAAKHFEIPAAKVACADYYGRYACPRTILARAAMKFRDHKNDLRTKQYAEAQLFTLEKYQRTVPCDCLK